MFSGGRSSRSTTVRVPAFTSDKTRDFVKNSTTSKTIDNNVVEGSRHLNAIKTKNFDSFICNNFLTVCGKSILYTKTIYFVYNLRVAFCGGCGSENWALGTQRLQATLKSHQEILRPSQRPYAHNTSAILV
jgi:hypothetical protein